MTRMSSFDETCSFLPSQAAQRWWEGPGRLCRAGADMVEPPRPGRARAGRRLAGTLRLLIDVNVSDGSCSHNMYTAGETIPFVRAMALVRRWPEPPVCAGPVLDAGAAGSGRAEWESAIQMPIGACAALVKPSISPQQAHAAPECSSGAAPASLRGFARPGGPPPGPRAPRGQDRAHPPLVTCPAAKPAPRTELSSNAAGAAVHRAGVYFSFARGNIFARLTSVSL